MGGGTMPALQPCQVIYPVVFMRSLSRRRWETSSSLPGFCLKCLSPGGLWWKFPNSRIWHLRSPWSSDNDRQAHRLASLCEQACTMFWLWAAWTAAQGQDHAHRLEALVPAPPRRCPRAPCVLEGLRRGGAPCDDGRAGHPAPGHARAWSHHAPGGSAPGHGG